MQEFLAVATKMSAEHLAHVDRGVKIWKNATNYTIKEVRADEIRDLVVSVEVPRFAAAAAEPFVLLIHIKLPGMNKSCRMLVGHHIARSAGRILASVPLLPDWAVEAVSCEWVH